MKVSSLDSQPNAYRQAAVVDGASRFVFVSGQTPEDENGAIADTFDGQCRQAWRNVLAMLAKSGMTEHNLVKVTVFLADRKYRDANALVRHEVLGKHCPALTVVIAGLYDERWLVEIEAIGAD